MKNYDPSNFNNARMVVVSRNGAYHSCLPIQSCNSQHNYIFLVDPTNFLPAFKYDGSADGHGQTNSDDVYRIHSIESDDSAVVEYKKQKACQDYKDNIMFAIKDTQNMELLAEIYNVIIALTALS